MVLGVEAEGKLQRQGPSPQRMSAASVPSHRTHRTGAPRALPRCPPQCSTAPSSSPACRAAPRRRRGTQPRAAPLLRSARRQNLLPLHQLVGPGSQRPGPCLRYGQLPPSWR